VSLDTLTVRRSSSIGVMVYGCVGFGRVGCHRALSVRVASLLRCRAVSGCVTSSVTFGRLVSMVSEALRQGVESYRS